MAHPPRLFVLDTTVLLHDPAAIYRFDEHDVYVPMAVLEELDAHKTGGSDDARNARQASRFLETLLGQARDPGAGVPLPGAHGHAGRLFIPVKGPDHPLPGALATRAADHPLLALTQDLTRAHTDREVVLVSKDINTRIKARVLGLAAEDYTSDRALDDADLLYPGTTSWVPGPQNRLHPKGSGEDVSYDAEGPIVRAWHPNEFLVSRNADHPPLIVRAIEGERAVLHPAKDYTTDQAVWGIHARNLEQSFALNLLMDPDIDLVTLLGQAGTGKTLLTLAAALQQTLDQKRYGEVIMTRVTIPVAEDIGFLPGTEEEKMSPWMGALEDNLEILSQTHLESANQSQWARAAAGDLVRSRVRIKSLNFMRGRTFLRKFLILDEAQNLTAHQIKTLVTRAGPGTKVVCLGNISQIDSPYLTETTSGLTYIVDRFKGWDHSGHITLRRGERSRLADHAAEVL